MTDDFIKKLRQEFTQLDEQVNEAPDADDFIEDGVDRYTDIQPFARGGIKQIYSCYDNSCRRTVAMAVLHKADDEEAKRNFLREAYLTSLLQHPNILPIHDIGRNEEGLFFTMKLIEGETLAEVLKKRAAGDKAYAQEYSQSRLLEMFVAICSALSYAHAQGIVHLDLKPENIQLSHYGEVLVCDWGLASVLDASCAEELLDRTEFSPSLALDKSGISGTPGYMAPEQTLLTASPDEKSDIYSLGAILYSLLAFRPPVNEKSLEESLRKTRKGLWKKPSHHVKEFIPPGLEAIVEKCLQLQPEDRYQSVQDLAEEVRRCLLGYASQAEEASVLRQCLLLYRRNKRFCLSLICSFLVIGVLLSAFFIALKEEKDLAQTARNQAEISRNQAEVARAQAQLQAQQLQQEKKEKQVLGVAAAQQRLKEAKSALMLERTEDFDKAYAAAQQCVLLDPQNDDAWYFKGELEIRNMQLAEAIASFAQLSPKRRLKQQNIQFLKDYHQRFSVNPPNEVEVLNFGCQLQDKQLNFAFRALYLRLLEQDLAVQIRTEYLTKIIVKINRLQDKSQVRFSKNDDGTVNLDLSGISKLRYLPSLRKLPIRRLNLSGTHILDTSILEGRKLEVLNLSNTSLKELGGCDKLPLKELHLSINSIANLTKLKTWKKLKKLYIPKGTLKHVRKQYKIPRQIQVIEE